MDPLKLKTFINSNDKMAGIIGAELVEVGYGTALARMTAQECHLNAAGSVHGGAIYTLADIALAGASNSHGRIALLANASISYLKPALCGDVLTAEAEELSCGHKMANYLIRVRNQNDELVACFSGAAYRKETGIPL